MGKSTISMTIFNSKLLAYQRVMDKQWIYNDGNRYVRYIILEGSSEVKLPTTWTDGKAEVGRVREEKRREEEEKRRGREGKRRERVRGKKIREEKESRERRCRHAKKQKNRETLCFSNDLWIFVAQEGRKVGSLKRHLAR